MRLVSVEIGFGLNDPPQVLLDIPDDWNLKQEYQDWANLLRGIGAMQPPHVDYTVEFKHPPSTFAEYLKLRGAKDSKNIERYP